MRVVGPVPAIALLTTLALLAGCVGTTPEATPNTPDAEGTTDTEAAPTPEGVGPDDGWLAFPGEPTTDEFRLEGAFQPQESPTPLPAVLNPLGLGQHAPANFHTYDISDRVPTGQPVWIFATLTHAAEGGAWINGPNEEFWVYDATTPGDGMEIATVVVRTGDAPMQIGVWLGEPATGPEVAYAVDVTVHFMPDWFPRAIVYGFDVQRGETLELRFNDDAPPESVWVWDDGDRFVGALSPQQGTLRITPGDPALDAEPGEIVVFATEDASRFQARVLTDVGTRAADFRVLDQVISPGGTWTMPGGTTTEHTYDVPVQPLQVGYSFFVPELVADLHLAFAGPDGDTLHESDRPGANPLGIGGFHNTDMGTPRMPTGTYTVTYTDTQSKDATVSAWYVTYGR